MEYAKEELIGRGGMADVFRGRALSARAVAPGTPVALKYLRDVNAAEPQVQERFYQEAKLCYELVHPNIVKVVDVDLDGRQPVMVMELLQGKTLRLQLKSGALPEIEALKIAIEILKALEAAHAHGTVHRDIKPGNIMLLDDGRVKVMDFGIARAHNSNLTVVGMQLGTAEYMSPEQIAAEHQIDGRSDLYSLATLLYEMLTGKTPFGDAGNGIAIATAQIQKAPPPLPASISSRTRSVIERALQKNPDARYPSARDMRAVLEMALSALQAPPFVEPQNLPKPPRPETQIMEEPVSPVAPKSPPIGVWIALGFGILLALLLAASNSNPQKPTQTTPTAALIAPPEATEAPTSEPTEEPTAEPTATSTAQPTATPTAKPTPTPRPTPLPIRIEQRVETRSIAPPRAQIQRNSALPRGQRRQIRSAVAGSREVTIEDSFRGAKKVGSKIVSSRVITYPQAAITEIGTFQAAPTPRPTRKPRPTPRPRPTRKPMPKPTPKIYY